MQIKLEKIDKVNVYEVLFSDNTTFFFGDSDINLETFVTQFVKANGFKSPGGSIYNTKNYIRIAEAGSEKYRRMVLDFSKVMIW